MDFTLLLWLLAGLLVLTGLAGLLLPMLPGAPLLFGGLLLAAWIEDFTYVGFGTLAVLALLAVLTYIVDFLSGLLGARHFGASRRAMIGACIGTMVGIFMGIIGVLIGPFIGAVIGELTMRRDISRASMAGLGTTIGLMLGIAAKMALAFSMLGIFLVMRFI